MQKLLLVFLSLVISGCTLFEQPQRKIIPAASLLGKTPQEVLAVMSPPDKVLYKDDKITPNKAELLRLQMLNEEAKEDMGATGAGAGFIQTAGRNKRDETMRGMSIEAEAQRSLKKYNWNFADEYWDYYLYENGNVYNGKKAIAFRQGIVIAVIHTAPNGMVTVLAKDNRYVK